MECLLLIADVDFDLNHHAQPQCAAIVRDTVVILDASTVVFEAHAADDDRTGQGIRADRLHLAEHVAVRVVVIDMQREQRAKVLRGEDLVRRVRPDEHRRSDEVALAVVGAPGYSLGEGFEGGAYLYLGDAHAAMGHGELSASGLEMASHTIIKFCVMDYLIDFG